jgi:hypothetical protein
VLYHLWTLIASRSCFIEEVPVPTAALPHGPQVPHGTLTWVGASAALPHGPQVPDGTLTWVGASVGFTRFSMRSYAPP